MIKLVIFDLDGTLINSIEDLADATNFVLNKNGFPVHEVEKYNYFVGDGVLKLIERTLPQEYRNQETILKVKEDFSEYYNAHYINKTIPYEGIIELITQLKVQNIKIAVASNKPDSFSKLIVNHFFKDTFDFVQGQTEIIPKKPSPEIALKIIDTFCVSKEETIFVGDTNVDIFTAKNASIKSVGCLWGFRTSEELEKAGADYIIAHPNELLYILNREERSNGLQH